MKCFVIFLFVFFLSLYSHAQSIAVNTDGSIANSSAILDVKTTSKGMLIPRMDSTQKAAIVAPATGLLVYQTNKDSGFYYYDGAAWLQLINANDKLWKRSGSSIYNSNTGNVGIGTNNPFTLFHVKSALDNPVIFDGGNNLYITMAENGINRGYIGSFSGSPEDVELGTYSGNPGTVHLTTNNTPRLSVINNGSVGIGTTSPATLLHVKSALSNPVIFDGGSNLYITLAENGVNRGYIGSFSGNAEDVELGTYNGNPGKVHLTTSNIPRLSVINNGNIGIGTSLPSTLFHVKSAFSNPVIFDGGSNLYITLAENGINRGYIGSFAGNEEDVEIGTYNGNTGTLHLTTNNTPRLSVIYDGRVGVGTSDPSELFEVAGKTKTKFLQVTADASPGKVLTSDIDGNASWEDPATAAASHWDISGSNIYNTNAGNVGIGLNNPLAKLHVADSSVLFAAIGDVPVTAGNVPVTGAGRRMMWYPGHAAFRAGFVSGSQWDKSFTGLYSAAFGRNTTAGATASFAAGDGSQALGINSIAMGGNALVVSGATNGIALGNLTNVSNLAAVAIGTDLNSAGQFSVALGSNSSANARSSVTIGNSLTANQDYALAMGFQSQATGISAVAIGRSAIASGLYATALGRNTTASGTSSFAAGEFSQALGSTSIAMGASALVVSGATNGIALGNLTNVSNLAAVAIGSTLNAAGQYSLALGSNSNASALSSVTIGNSLTANQDYALAMGFQSQATGISAVAIGRTAVASGLYATALGRNTTASGTSSFAAGEFSQALGSTSIAMGASALVVSGATNGIALGNLTNVSNLAAVAIGSTLTAAGQYSLALGSNSNASALSSVTIGNSLTANQDYALAMGFQSQATGISAVAIGRTAVANGLYATALGKNTTASGSASFAAGEFSQANGIRSVALGDSVIAVGVSSFAAGENTVARGNFSSSLGNFTIARSLNSLAIGVYNDTTNTNRLFEIGNGTANNARANAMTVLDNGHVGIGNINPTERLQVTGNILASGTITPSDIRYKKNIQSIPGALDKVMQLKGVFYELRRNEFPEMGFNDRLQVGLIAQEVEKVLPGVVYTGSNGYKAVDYAKVVPLLVEAIKEQQVQINEQKKMIEQLLQLKSK